MAWKNKEARNEYERKKYRENPEKTIKRTNEYLKNTPKGRACRLAVNYRHMDRKANRGESTITAQWIVDNILFKPCAHCGKIGWDIIGCNRINNDLPHTPDNVEPCCEHCNHVLGGKINGKKVYQYTMDGELVKIWENGNECAQFGFTHIWDCCNGKRKSNKGYRWSYVPL